MATLRFTKKVDAYPDINVGDEIENAESLFGPAQTAYFLETGHAEAVGAKKETATAKKGETPEK